MSKDLQKKPVQEQPDTTQVQLEKVKQNEIIQLQQQSCDVVSKRFDLSQHSYNWKNIIANKTNVFKKTQQIYAQALELKDQDLEEIMKQEWGDLKVIDVCTLNNNKIGNSGIKMLVQLQSFRNLQTLELNKNRIQSKTIKYLVKGDFPNLKRLFLGWDDINDEGALHLSKSNWPNLIEIALGILFIILCSCNIGLNGTYNLFSKSIWKNLNILWYRYNLKQLIGIVQLICMSPIQMKLYYQHKWSQLNQIQMIKKIEWIQ